MKNAKKITSKREILNIRGLSFIADRKIVDNISWRVLEGERWALLGANGAGKTSLISTICAYNTPSEGEMSVDGKKYTEYNWSKMRERIALVGSQLRRGINRGEKVMEVVVSGKFAQINYWGRITRKLAKEAYAQMERFGIGHLVDSDWFLISQGERQKVLLARAMMLKPSVVFLDEPCSGLDPVARRDFVKFLGGLCADKNIPAIIMATHYVEEIPPEFTHAMVIKDGAVLAQGKIGKAMTSENLSLAYGAKCALSKKRGRYRLEIE